MNSFQFHTYLFIYICNMPAILLATGDAVFDKRDTIPLLVVIRFKRGRQKLSQSYMMDITKGERDSTNK